LLGQAEEFAESFVVVFVSRWAARVAERLALDKEQSLEVEQGVVEQSLLFEGGDSVNLRYGCGVAAAEGIGDIGQASFVFIQRVEVLLAGGVSAGEGPGQVADGQSKGLEVDFGQIVSGFSEPVRGRGLAVGKGRRLDYGQRPTDDEAKTDRSSLFCGFHCKAHSMWFRRFAYTYIVKRAFLQVRIRDGAHAPQADYP
jgi:hypothetical protein